ncbi:prolyl oligopeptidase family serine peptidase [Shewanella sp. NIFS-20-20]|uniref:S9 family peptidase n=1 Tax=Shewanella sp. NIFS-20-20 TaxID=2853806 RepID=UPI001C4465AE|nr:prolyl oligopeptidase family serine peptidase [Shewanella sp. NIFS-20-20]MBV7316760.1 prolyl oligopeptidase family serine peptidase [Shewanella sp. NIFS-20-20]
MKSLLRHVALSAVAVAVLSGCGLSAVSTQPQVSVNPEVNQTLTQPPVADAPLTLQQIMANPDWMGILAQRPYFSADSNTIYFERQPSQAAVAERFSVNLATNAITPLAINAFHQAPKDVHNSPNGHYQAYLHQGNLMVKRQSDNRLIPMITPANAIDGIRFLNNNTLAYWQQDQIHAIDLADGTTTLLANLQWQDAPKDIQEPSSYIAKQQHRLIKYVADEHQRTKDKAAHKAQLQAQDPVLAPKPWYLGDNKRLVDMSLSPDGQYVVLAVTAKDASWRQEHDIMPNYLGKDGYVEAVPVRARVAEAQPPGQEFILLDLNNHKQIPITIEGLTGYDADVLASVKAENAKAKGDSYHSEKQVRNVQLMQDWGWDQSAIQWHDSEPKLALMIEAQDNKDRWLATVDLKRGKLITQDRLHDDAWINYDYNQFGWIPATDSLYFLSEKTGYSQLYIKPLSGTAKALTQGDYVVSDVSLSPDNQYLYYKANKTHPGIYNVYRVNIATGLDEAVTDWDGNLDYQLSPDGQSLLLTASRRTEPNELYLQPIGGELRQLTDFTSAEFKAYPWQAPQVVAVPSSHGANDIYARVYLPQGYDASQADKYPAVIFNHGAGYLQNADYGFSGYFREFMFHNLLAQQGYVVMDMDYRGSKGYGRDWRTAIYRQMGHPEVEDLSDGVKWMQANANVDAAKVGTYGGSYGGFLTFMALFTQPELFQAGAALRPVTDWAHYNAPYTSNILNTPDVDPLAYERSSPIEHAEGLQKPLLIMTGVLDDNVFFQDSVRLVQRLIELEKPMFETAIYPVEPHGFKQPSSWLDEYRRIYALFEDNLK